MENSRNRVDIRLSNLNSNNYLKLVPRPIFLFQTISNRSFVAALKATNSFEVHETKPF